MKTFKLSLFQAFGVELEYMIVDKDTLNVKPIADLLFQDVLGFSGNEVEFPLVSWSNELARHVVEIKTTEPVLDLVHLSEGFQKNISLINQKLSVYNAQLMPGAAHPWMDPLKETVLWQHENSEIYETYNKVFNCKGHGWSNLQSTHINLPFGNDQEFGQLHAAIRLLLPIIPALTASSPMLDGSFTGWLDTRLSYYQRNQSIIPSITGKVVPEPIFSEKDYREQVFDVISKDVAPYDPNQILEPIWLNSRGAIARFDRGAIEIRIIDIQECPNADIAVLSLVIAALKALVDGKFLSIAKLQEWGTEPLFQIFNQTAQFGEEAVIENSAYLEAFGLTGRISVKARDLWKHILDLLTNDAHNEIHQWLPQILVILEQGTLATRIKKALGTDFSKTDLKRVYQRMVDCLEHNEMFIN